MTITVVDLAGDPLQVTDVTNPGITPGVLVVAGPPGPPGPTGASEVLYADDYGVVGNGTTDDTTALQNFLNTAAAAKKVAQLNAGMTVRVTSAINPPTGTRLDLNGATIKNASASTTGRILVLSGVSDIWIGNGTLNGDKASFGTVTEQRHNLHIVNSQRITIENLISKLAKGDGIYVGDQTAGYSSDIRLDNVTCDANHRQGMSITHVDGLTAVKCRFINTSGTAPQAGVDIEPNTGTVVCTRIKFVACEFNNNTGYGFDFVGQNAPAARQGDVDVIGCTYLGNGANGIRVSDGTNLRFVGGDVRSNGQEGFLLTNAVGALSTDVSMTGMLFQTNGREGFKISSGEVGVGLSIEGCTFLGNGTATTNLYAGINIGPAAGTTHVRIIGNRFDGAAQKYGVLTNANVSKLALIANSYGTLGTADTSLGDDAITRYVLERGIRSTHKQMYSEAGGTTMWELYATGDSVARVAARTDGALTFSSGSAAQDTILSRPAVGVLALGADDSFKTGRAATGSRPSAATAGQGSMFFDTTLNQPIWSDGANWNAAAPALALNVRSAPYNAVGDNVATDTTAFLNAIADAAAQQIPLFIPGGHYKLPGGLGTLPDGLIMYGAGQTPTNGTPTRLNFTGIASGTAGIVINGGSNVVLRDFYVTGRASGTADEISVIGQSRAVVIERVTVNSATTGAAFALATTGGASHNLIKSSIRNCTAVGAGYGFRIGTSSTSIDFESCYANACTVAGYLIQGTYLSFISCAADANALYGYLVQSAVGITFVSCGAEQSSRSGWHCTGALNVTLIGCRGVSNNTSANAALPSFLGINDASDYVTCIGCVDTTPNAASTSAVSNWQGTVPVFVTLLNNDFTAKGVHSSLRDTVAVRRVALQAGTTGKAPLNIPAGVAPTSPVDGDIWATTAGLYTRVNGGTVGPLQSALVINVRDFGATGDGTTDDTAAIQAAINAAKVAATNRGAVVYLPPGAYLVSSPLILPRTGTTPANVVTLRGASVRTAYLLGGGSFPTGRAVIEWEATTSRTWHQEITDLMIRPPLVAGCRAVHYKKNAGGTTLADFNNERMQITMRDVLIEGNNGYHTSLIKLEGQVFFSSFERVYGDNAPSSLIGSYQPITDVDTLLFEFESGLFGGAVSDDITGLSYSTIRNCVAGSIRRGGRGALIKGRAKSSQIQNCWVDGTRYDNGVYLLNSFSSSVTAVNNEGRSGTNIYIQDSVGITLDRIAFANQDPEFPDWAASTAYTTAQGVIVPGWRSNLTGAAPANNNWFQCTTAGTTGASQPSWPTTPSATVTDGSVVWTCVGPAVSDAIVVDGGTDITLRNFDCDSGKGITTSRGYKALRLKNAPVNVRADNYSVPGDPTSDVAWINSSGVGNFRGARNGERVTLGNPQIDSYTSSGTWTKPAGAVRVLIKLLGAGGGGGSGRRGAAGTVRAGAGGGGGAGFTQVDVPASQLAGSVTVTIGAIGVGAAAVTADDTNGATGTQGGVTTFGSYRAYGGGGSAGGAAGAGSGGAGNVGTSLGAVGGASSATGAVGAGGAIGAGASGGGAGGGITSANVASNGAAGGTPFTSVVSGTGGTGGVVDTTAPTNGGNFTSGQAGPGAGGGGGAGSITTAAQAGANGGSYGAGGGGGGASLNGNNSGKGGDGGPGIAEIITYFQ
jgi:hypothetical protein